MTEPPSRQQPASASTGASLGAAGWPLPERVRAYVTHRQGGVSEGPYGLDGGAAGGLNLGARCGDRAEHVAANRARLRAHLPGEPVWLHQVHGASVFWADTRQDGGGSAVEPVADAAVTSEPGRVLAILCADCLPVLITDQRGERIGAAHAGWRGLSAGVIEATFKALQTLPGADNNWVAWLGPAIGPTAFEVGEEVRDAFRLTDPGSELCFMPSGQPGKWLADLFELARRRLRAIGIRQIGGGGQCTVSLSRQYYSHRRDRISGRQAALIWIR